MNEYEYVYINFERNNFSKDLNCGENFLNRMTSAKIPIILEHNGCSEVEVTVVIPMT